MKSLKPWPVMLWTFAGAVQGKWCTSHQWWWPWATPKVLIRGVTTANGTNPLVCSDGMPVGDNINFLNSNDIASMEVLKRCSAAAICGTRASNGVILITKKGKTGKARINWNSSVGFQTVANLILPVRLNIKKCSIPVIRMMAFFYLERCYDQSRWYRLVGYCSQ